MTAETTTETTAAVVERPIIMSGPMVRAILQGRKTQTRRVVRWRMLPGEENLNLGFSGLELGHYATDVPASGFVLRSRGAGGCWNDRTHPYKPRFRPGMRLWVRETWGEFDPRHFYDLAKPKEAIVREACRVDGHWHPARNGCYYAADVDNPDSDRARLELGYLYRPSIHMPRWVSRINLVVTAHRIERLRAINRKDAVAEGVSAKAIRLAERLGIGKHAEAGFQALWDGLNVKRGFGWKQNPYVDVITFRREDDV